MVKYRFRESTNHPPMYPYPSWRRAPFVALLLVVVVLNYAPATTQGTATVSLSTLSAPSPITHLYIALSAVQLHQRGYLNSSGWTSISQAFPVVDILSPTARYTPTLLTSAPVHSGSYDSIRLSFTNSTVEISGTRFPLMAPPSLSANMTMPVPPNGIGDVLIIVAFDYTPLLLTRPPGPISFVLISVSAI